MADRKLTDEEKRSAVTRWEEDHDIVRGSATYGSHGPEGGQEWEGRARMAQARKLAGRFLNLLDREALDRYPQG